MKLLRIFLWVLAGLTLVFIAVLALAFTPGVQTWAFRKATADYAPANISVARVAVGLHHSEIAGLRIEQNGALVTVPDISFDLPLMAAALGKRVALTSLVAKGWTVDLTRVAVASSVPATGPAGGATSNRGGVSASSNSTMANRSPALTGNSRVESSPFRGFFSNVTLPADLSADGIAIAGRALLPGAGASPPTQVSISLSGGGLGAGKRGDFRLEVEAKGMAPAVPVSQVGIHGNVGLTMDSPRTFTGALVQLEVSATGGMIAQKVALQITANALKNATGETYAVSLTNGKPLLEVHADYAAATNQLSGSWSANSQSGDLASLGMENLVPVYAVSGSGKFTADPVSLDATFSGNISSTVSELSRVNAQLAAVGKTEFKAAFDVARHGSSFRVQQLDVDMVAARPVFSAHALQPFEFNPATGELKVADASKDLLAISLQAIPLSWVAAALPGFVIAGEDLHGELIANARNGGASLSTKSPLVLKAFSLAQGTKPLLQNLNLTAAFAGDYTPQGWQVDISAVRIASGPSAALSFDLKAGQLTGANQSIKAEGHLSADLASWMAQPIAQGTIPLQKGSIEGQFTANVGAATQEAAAKFSISNLSVDPKLSADPLPSIQADLRLDRTGGTRVAFSAPLVVDRAGRKSDLTLAGSYDASKAVPVLDLRVSSSSLVVDDLKPFAAFAPGGPEAPAAPAKTAGKPDATPVWAGISGQLALDLKKITYGATTQVNNVVGTMRVSPTALTFENIRAGISEGADFRLNGGVNFLPNAPEPYVLKAETTLNNFDTAPVLRALDPSKAPSIEGKFNVSTKVEGSSATLYDLGDRARGDVEITSKGGLFRVLAADVSDKIQKTQSAVSALGGFLGAVTGRDKVSDYANKTQIVSDIAQALKEIHYDQLNMHALRDEKLNLTLQDLTLISPEIRLGGNGQITYRAGVAIPTQPLDFNVQISARGKTGDLMKRVGMLGGTPDSLGYFPFTVPVHIKGTVEHPDTSELRNALLKAAGGSLINSLLGS